jgi:hypothetical protein
MLDIEVGCVDTILGLNNEGAGPATLERFIATIDGTAIDLLSGSGIKEVMNTLLAGALHAHAWLAQGLGDSRRRHRSNGLFRGNCVD